jgi:hypothetical protein
MASCFQAPPNSLYQYIINIHITVITTNYKLNSFTISLQYDVGSSIIPHCIILGYYNIENNNICYTRGAVIETKTYLYNIIIYLVLTRTDGRLRTVQSES